MFYMYVPDYDNYCASFRSTHTNTGTIITILLHCKSPSNEELFRAEMPPETPSGVTVTVS